MSQRRVMPEAVRIAPASLEKTDREGWLAMRRTGIGGSDIAAILGLDPYRSALDVFMDKTGQGEARPSAALEESARFGQLMENVVAEEFERRSGLRLLSSPGMVANIAYPWAYANLDRLVTNISAGPAPMHRKFPLEIKTRSARQSEQWRDGPADGPSLQLAWYLAVTGARKGYIAALIGGNQLKWFEVERDDELILMLIEAAVEFRERLANDDPPPPDGLPRTSNLLDSIWGGDPDKFLMVTGEQAADVRRDVAVAAEFTAAAKAAKEGRAQAENRIKLLMGDAEVVLAGADVLARWTRKGTFRQNDFIKDHPGLAEKYFRVRQVVDTTRLAEDEPEMYRSYRARILRLAGTGDEDE